MARGLGWLAWVSGIVCVCCMAVENIHGRAAILDAQARSLRVLLERVASAGGFYSQKFVASPPNLPPPSTPPAEQLRAYSRSAPLTLKSEIAADQLTNPPYGTNLTSPIQCYTRAHQTSGTTGTPIRWLDTPESWDAMLELWREVLIKAGIGAQDRILFAFSFGPFIGFWLAFEAASRVGSLCLAAGGMSSVARLKMLLDHQATVLCCTPTYALHLADMAAKEGIAMDRSMVRLVLVAGEPGGSLPAMRERISSAWNHARVFDHHGMTEVGPVTYECPVCPGVLHVMESGYYAEVLTPGTNDPIGPGEPGELVLTTLRRFGSPLLRYRTGDLVRLRHDPLDARAEPCACGSCQLALPGGILGRTDDMVVIRGVNIYPSAVDELIRREPGVGEYQVTLDLHSGMHEMVVRIEPVPGGEDVAAVAHHLERTFQVAFSLRVPVIPVPIRSLPRFEMKARRWVRS